MEIQDSSDGRGTLAAGEWVQIATDTPDVQTGGTRGLYTGGSSSPSFTDEIDYVNLETTGNAIDFGNLLVASSYEGGGLASRTRGLFAGGHASPSDTDTIEFVTIASTGNGTDFGNLHTGAGRVSDTLANETRGIFAGAESPSKVNTIRYITIASAEDTVDFGDMNASKGLGTGCASSTRGLLAGGRTPTFKYH